MNKIYIVDGVQYNVSPNREEEFLKKFPTAILEEQVEDPTLNVAVEDEAALESIDTDLTSETVLSDYDTEIKNINLSYDEQINNLDVTESDKELYSSFVVDENVVETKTKQLNEQRLKDLTLAEQKRNDRQLLADNKNPKTSSGRGIHSWLDNESTTETFSQYEKMNRGDYESTIKALEDAYPDYGFEIADENKFFGYDIGGGTNVGVTMTAPNGETTFISDVKDGVDGKIGSGSTTKMKSDIIKFVNTHGYDAKLYDQVDRNISQQHKKIENIVSITDKEKAEIEESVADINLSEEQTKDTSYEKSISNFNAPLFTLDGSDIKGTTVQTGGKQFYQPQIDQAEKMLNDARAIANKKRSIDDQLPPATKEEIDAAARKIIYNQKINQLSDDKWTDYLEANDDEMQGVLKFYKAVEQDQSFKKVAGLQTLQQVEIDDFNSSASEGKKFNSSSNNNLSSFSIILYRLSPNDKQFSSISKSKSIFLQYSFSLFICFIILF